MNFQPHHGQQWPTMQQSSYRPAEQMQSPPPALSRSRYDGYQIQVIQNPTCGRVAIGKEKDRKPLDPPPFVKLTVPEANDPTKIHMHSPYLIIHAYLEPAPSATPVREEDRRNVGPQLVGTTASSLHRLKADDNHDVAIFVFPDLTVKREGFFILRFVLMNLEEDPTSGSIGDWVTICECHSQTFQVFSPRGFPGMAESTFLTRSFSDQGVRLRLRKDSRALSTRKQNNSLARANQKKRARELPGSIDTPSNEHTDGHREPVTNAYYDSPTSYGEQLDMKRQRTSSAAEHGYMMQDSMGSGMPFEMMTTTSGYPPATTSLAQAPHYANAQLPVPPNYQQAMPAMGPPRGPSGRLNTQINPGYQHGLMQSPSNSYTYSSPQAQSSPSLQDIPNAPQFQGIHPFQGILPSVRSLSHGLTADNARMTTSPPAHSHSTDTTGSSTGSPVDAYTLGPNYTGSFVQATSGSYEQGTLRGTNGITTPVTGDMPPESMHGQSMFHQMLSSEGAKPTSNA
ncbi:velvet factor-domain-containing protein [Xylariales sp. AK1849]|nr:velvet factor-domain-containing protein [Xylariales sp. AK1849]